MEEEKKTTTKDVETGNIAIKNAKPVEESLTVQVFWLLAWMLNNVLVTMINKAAFAKVDFKYPFTLSAVHMACCLVGAQTYFLFSNNTKPKQLDAKDSKTIMFFSIIFSLNIAIGNVSLRWVSVNFNQIARSLVPVIAMTISMIFYHKNYSQERKWAVLPIVVGVVLSFYGDMSFTTVGVVYTLLCILLAALKVVVGGELLSGELKLHEMDLLAKMCPLAFVQIGTIALLNGEISQIISRWDELVGTSAFQVVLISGVLSFALNVCSFIANKVTSPLTLCISANVKQVLVVGLSTLYFGDSVSVVNAIGILIVIIGSYRYGVASIVDKGR